MKYLTWIYLNYACIRRWDFCYGPKPNSMFLPENLWLGRVGLFVEFVNLSEVRDGTRRSPDSARIAFSTRFQVGETKSKGWLDCPRLVHGDHFVACTLDFVESDLYSPSQLSAMPNHSAWIATAQGLRLRAIQMRVNKFLNAINEQNAWRTKIRFRFLF